MTLSFPSWRQREVHREERAEGVAVRVLVRRDEKAVVLTERGRDGRHVIGLRHRRGAAPRVSGASSSIICVRRTPRSTPGS